MPPLSRIHSAPLADLAKQLRFVPAETARRHVEHAESMLAVIDAEGAYPEDWVVQRITGYRPDIPAPAIIPGQALLADLAALIERLSIAAAYRAAELDGARWLAPAELARELGITTRTLQRLRRRGLLVRRAAGPGGKPVTRYNLDSARRLLAAGAAPASPRRVGPEETAQIARKVRVARASHSRSGATRAIAATAKEHERSPSTIRRALKKSGALRDRPALSSGQRAAVLAALESGDTAAAIARRLGRTAATIHRAASLARAARLRSLDLGPHFDPARDVHLDDPALLEPPPARLALGAPAAPTLAAHIAAAEQAGWPDAGVESVRARAYAALLDRARRAIASLDRYAPAAAALDAIDTDLLWAARLKAELVRSQQMLTLRTIATRLGTDLAGLPPVAARALLLTCLDAVAAAVDPHDPFKGGRLAAPAGIALNRAVARWQAGPGRDATTPARGAATRAAPLAHAADAPLPDWTRSVAAWQSWLEPPAAVRRHIEQLPELSGALIAARFGYTGERPRSIAALAAEFRLPVHVVSRRIHAAVFKPAGAQ